jgi:PAS domain S-box-containing protein
MSTSDFDKEKTLQEQELRIQRHIAFAAGLFQGDVTIRTLLESLAEGVVIIDNSGTILLVNTSAGQMFGYPEKELIGKPHAVIFPERFRTVLEAHEADYIKEPRIKPMAQLLELAGRRFDGSEFPVEINLSFIETINGVLVLALVSDITLRRQYELSLRESEELFHIQVEGVQDYAIFMLDCQGNVLNWNAGAERLKGYRAEEIIGKHCSCFYPQEEQNAGNPAEGLKKAAAEGRVSYEGWRIRKDGSRFWADVIITALYDESGNLRGFSKVTHDITGRKKVEDALRFSEARYRTLFHDNPTMIVTLAADLTVLTVNPFCASQLGYTTDELEGQPVLKLFHEDDRPAVAEQLRRCLQNPNQVKHWQFRKIRKNGDLLWVEETAQAIYDLSGALNILVVCQDITERKHLEDELKQTSMQNELILASAGEGIIGLDLEGNQSFVNAAAATMLGYDVNELVGIHSHSIWHYARPDGSHYHEEKCPVYAAYKDGTVHSGEEMFLRKDGTFLPVQFTSRPIITDGKITGAVLTFNDITERKRSEEVLEQSEERFRATFNQAAVGIGHVTPDGRWLRINQKYCDVVGYTEEEIKALTIQGITHPDDLETSMQHYQLLLEGKLDNYSLEKRYIRKDGSTIWVNITASMVFDDGGNPMFAIGVVEDISRRKRAEEERDWVYKYSLDMLCVAGFDGYFKRVSPSFEKILGWSEAELLSTSIFDFIHPDNLEATCQEFKSLEGGKQAINFENRYRCKDGSYKWLSWHSHPMIENKLIIGVARDITERKRVEKDIERLNADLEARAVDLEYVNQELEAFNYTVAHDLRNPLNVISSYCQVFTELCGDKLDEQCLRYIQETYNGTLRMNLLIETLLNFSRLSHAELNRESVDLSSMANEVAGELKGSEAARRVDFHIADGMVADGDANLLRVALANLLGNAWKYTATREEALIEFGTQEIDGKPVYYVRDNGSGFDNAAAEKIFAPFQRLPGAEEYRGFGIGLATVERIIRRHGGRVCAEGEPGKGATFWFTLSTDGA